jgi:hypothetical protein
MIFVIKSLHSVYKKPRLPVDNQTYQWFIILFMNAIRNCLNSVKVTINLNFNIDITIAISIVWYLTK